VGRGARPDGGLHQGGLTRPPIVRRGSRPASGRPRPPRRSGRPARPPAPAR
jgi:hypothetical protein